MATIVAAAGGGNWTTGGTWVGGVAPTAADDVQLTSSSGNVTIVAGSVARSLDCTGYTGTLTHNNVATLALGDATAGASNIALKFVAGMTYTIISTTTSIISFVSTSATQQTIATGGKTLGVMDISGLGGSYILADSNTTSGGLTYSAGIFNTGNQTCTWFGVNITTTNAKTLSLGSSAITVTQSGAPGWEHPGNTTISANTATLTFTNGTGIFDVYGKHMNGLSVVFTGGGAQVLNGCDVANMTYTGTANKTNTMLLTGDILISGGTLTVNGNSAVNRVLVLSNVLGTPRIITAPAVSFSNVDFADITGAGTANWNLSGITGGSGDCLGNTGITFTSAAPQTHTASAGGNWSDVTKWTSRVPLPQDNVFIDVNTTGTLTVDMPRLGANIDFTGFTGTAAFASTANTSFGNWKNGVGMTISGTQGLTLGGRGSNTLTSNGRTFTQGITVSNPGATFTLLDTLVTQGSFVPSYGTLNTNDVTVTCLTYLQSQSSVVVNLGNSTINVTSTAVGNIFTRGSGTLNGGTATVVIMNASANSRTVQGGNGMATATINYTVNGSTGALVFNLASSWGTINFTDNLNGRTFTLPAGVTTTVTNFNVVGSAGKIVTINSNTPGSQATLAKTSGFVSADYLSIQDSAATGGASWYAGSNSANVSGNTGWFFTAYSASKFLELM